MIWLTGLAGFNVLIQKMKGHLFSKYLLNTYYVPGVTLGVGNLARCQGFQSSGKSGN